MKKNVVFVRRRRGALFVSFLAAFTMPMATACATLIGLDDDGTVPRIASSNDASIGDLARDSASRPDATLEGSVPVTDASITALEDGGASSSGGGSLDAALLDAASSSCGADAGIVTAAGFCAEPIAELQDDPQHVLVAGTRVYWSVFGRTSAGLINSAALDGSDVTLFSFAATHPRFLFAHAGDLYWGAQANGGSEESSAGCIERKPLDGGFSFEIVPLFATYSVRGVAVDASFLYWLTWDGLLLRKSLSSGSQEVLAAGRTNPIALEIDDAGLVYSLGGGSDAGAGGGSLEAKELDGGLKWAAPDASGQPNNNNNNNNNNNKLSPSGAKIENDFVYWTDHGGSSGDGGVGGGVGALHRMSRSTGLGDVVMCADQPGPLFLAVDATHVWFTNEGHGDRDGQIVRVAKAGGSCEVVVSGLAKPHGIDATTVGPAVYFTTRGDGRVWRLHAN